MCRVKQLLVPVAALRSLAHLGDHCDVPWLRGVRKINPLPDPVEVLILKSPAVDWLRSLWHHYASRSEVHGAVEHLPRSAAMAAGHRSLGNVAVQRVSGGERYATGQDGNREMGKGPTVHNLFLMHFDARSPGVCGPSGFLTWIYDCRQ